MKTITYQTKYFGMMRKILIVVMLSLAVLLGEGTVDFLMSGYADDINVYNLITKEEGNGGFTVIGSNLDVEIYTVEISWGGAFYNINGEGFNNGDDENGRLYGGGEFKPHTNGSCQISFSHDELIATTGFPGNVENKTMSLRIQNGETDAYVPSASGDDFNWDLVAPVLQSIAIESDNDDSEWATTDDEIKITLTAENEDLGQASYWSKTIQSLAATNTAHPSNDKIWYVTCDVGGSHAEGETRFTITYYDVNYNPSATAITQSTAGVIGTVTIDKTAPIISATILSNDNVNNASNLATTDDVVTLSISAQDADGADEIIRVPTVTMATAPPTSMIPSVAAASYTATRTMASDDAQGAVAFNISGIEDRAGNTASAVSLHTSGNSVIFDSVVPTLSTVSISSDNAISDDQAKVNDTVTLSFTATGNESLQTPVVTIDGENTTEAQDSNDYTWTATKLMDAEDNEQDVEFRIAFKDLAANSGTAVVAVAGTGASTSVMFDATDPVINSTTLETTNDYDDELATTDDVIIINISSALALYSIKDAAIAGQSVSDQTTVATNVTSWTVNHTVAGTEDDGYANYTYTAVDLAGNTTTVTSASSDIRIDNTAPELNTIEIYSDNDDITQAKIDNIVTVKVVANEQLRIDPVISIRGNNATITAAGDGITYYGAYQMDNLDTEGAVAFTITFENTLGVPGSTITDDGSGSTTSNASAVTFDRTAPTLSAVTISTNNDNTAYAKEGSIITLSFTAANTENLLADPTVTILTEAAAVSGSGASWAATYTATTGDNEGTVPFTIDFFDYAGNAGTQVDAIVSGDDVIFDETVPTLTTASITSANTNDPAGTLAIVGDQITISIVADNNIQTPTITVAGNAATIATGTNGESVYTATYDMVLSDATADAIAFTVDFLDLAGNPGVQVAALANDADGGVSFDKQAPSFTTVSIASDNTVSDATADDNGTRAKVGDDITITLVSDEDLKVGLEPTVTIAGNTAVVTRNTASSFSAVYEMASSDDDYDGLAIPIYIYFYDDPSGNTGDDVTATLDGSEVIFDMTAPVLGTATIASDNDFTHWAKATDVITLTIVSDEDLEEDPVVSLLGSTADVSPPIAGVDAKNWSVTKTVTGGSPQGTVAFSVTFEDVVGNSGTVVTSKTGGKNVTVDRGTPTIQTADFYSDLDGSPHLSTPENGSGITLDVTASEDIIEPTITIAGQTTTVTDESDDDGATWQGAYTMTEAEDDGVIAFVIAFTDSAGNAGTDRTTINNDTDGLTVSFDKTQPNFNNVTISSDNTGKNQYARAGSFITLSFESSEDLESTTVTINEVTTAASLSGDTYTAIYEIENDTDDNGGAGYTVPFTILARDLNGYDSDVLDETSDGTSITFDKTTPGVTTLILTSSNANDLTLAKVGDVLTLELVANEVLQQPTFSIAGETTITEEAGGTNASWSGTYTMQNMDTEGDQAIQVDFMDYAGNSVATTIVTTDGSAVRFDKTVPTLDAVTIVSDNIYSNQAAKTENTLTLSIEASEDLKSAPMFTIGSGAAFAATQGASASDWSGTYIMQAGDTEGEVAFSISFEDLAANSGVDVTATLDGTSVTFDKTATDISNVALDLVDGSDSGVSSSDNLTNDQTPEFQITGLQPGVADDTQDAVGDSIFFYVDGVQIDLQDGSKGGVPISGALSLVLSTLAHQELAYEVRVVSKDPAGNTSIHSAPINIRIDTEASSASSVPNLVASDDSGFLDNDDITNVQQPTFLVWTSSTDRDSVRLFYNIGASDVLVGGFRKPDNGFQYGYFQAPTTLSENDYTFSAVLVDSAGNVSDESGGLEVTIDVSGSDQPGNPNLIAGYDSGVSTTDDITNLTTIAFNVTGLTAGDSLYIVNGDDEVVSEELLAGTSSNPTVYNAVTSTYTAYTKDIAGNQSLASGGLDVIVDLDAPDVASVRSYLSTSSDLGTLDNDNLTNDFTPEIEAQNLIVNDSAFLYVDGALNQRLKADATTMLFTADSLSDNTHAISIKIQDIAGNLSDFAPLTKNADLVSLAHEIRIDTQPPTISSRPPDLLLEDDAGFSGSDDITNIRSPRFELVALPSDLDSIRLFYDPGTGDQVSKEMRMSQIVLDTIQTGSSLGAGTYSFTYVILDSAGNVSDTSSALSLIVDVSPPDVPSAADLVVSSDVGQSSTDNLTNVATPEFTVTGILEGDLASLYYYIDDAADPTLVSTEFVSSESLTFTTSALDSGIYTFFSVASDTAGNKRQGPDLEVIIDLDIPTAEIVFDGDSLVRSGDEETVATFQFSEIMDDATNPPTIDVDYPEGTSNDLTGQALTNGGIIDGVILSDSVWSYTIPLNTSGLEAIDGVIALTLNASDLAGNTVPVDSITGLSVLRVDNTTPVFSSFYVDTDTSINVLNKFGWTLSETIDSGSVVFEKISGPGDNVTAILEGIELEEGEHAPSAFADTNFALTEGTIYDIIYTSVDTAGNIGLDTVANVNYDTTGSSATVTFSQLFVTGDSTVTITATFNEPVLPAPTISLDFAGNFNDIPDSSMTISSENDASIWTLSIQAPTGGENQGNVGVSITAMDLATNTLDTTIITDTLYVDNTVTIADFSYINISQEDSVGNVGIGDDVIQVTVQMNEPIIVYDPIPSLNYTYAGTTGNSVNGVIAQSSSNGDSVWVFQITLQDTVHNDGPLNITLVAKDRSNNDVTNFTNNTLFQVDNKHPADFAVGATTVFGNNAVQGWINGKTDSVGFVIPIQANSEDSTLFLGGYTKIQFYNLTRGVAWVTVGTQDSLTQAGVDEIFYRTIVEIEAAMSPNSALILGDSLEIRASITDRNGNLTHSTASTQKLVYDPVAPVVGQINGGNMFTDTPLIPNNLYSNDTLSIQWSEFVDEGDDASGIDKYELAFEKVESEGTEPNNFYGWEEVALPNVPLEYTDFNEKYLEHNEKYRGHVRGIDVAGNISDTLVTDTLFRYNTKPTIATLIDAALDEDISWTDTIALTDPDLFVMQGDSFTYKAITTRLVGSVATDSVKIDSSGVLTWTPTQNDTGTYEIQVIATDAYAFADTFKLPLIVSAVNDTPVVDILSPDNNLEWVEDDTATVKINLTSYLEDVDNNDSTEITWQAIILDTTQLDEDFPLGHVIVGPGTPWNVHSSLLREYLGFDLNPKGMKSPVISRRTTNQINTRNNMSNPLLSVTINTISSGESWAYFNSDSNYYGSDHRIIFIAQDPYGAEDRDTVIVTVLPKNDAPIISEIPLIEVTENDSIYLKFGAFTTDIDDTDLTFTISATTNEDKISISPSTFLSNDVGDSVLFLPEKLWSQDATIKVIVTDNDEASDTATFILDVIRVPRPEIKVAVVQNNAFSNYLQVIVTDTVSKTKFISLEVQNEDIDLDTIAAFTWAGDFNFSTAGNYSIDVLAIADVGDTVVTELIALAAAREASRWFGRSVDGRFSVAGDPGSVSYDQSFIIVDSSLFADDFNDQASYVLGDEFFEFGKPIEVRFGSQRDDLAIYRRKNGVTWEELPSILIDGEIFTFSEKTGYFKLGPKTIIVPEETNIHQNYPNPFNPITTIMYDIGLMEGLSQNVSITIYNLLGQHVKTLIHDKDQVGQFTVQWNGQNEFGQPMSTGVYFVQLTTKTGIIKNKKMMLLK
ncbi:MAG: T9SS type A sorting domain-containing protein [Candidatus Marinimicrobia bacterium]|nr:T9SS type A sorting domain-containing protein [Candidatus Neomarinimicrobiota bacterium]